MKKTNMRNLFLVLAVALIAFTSCTKEYTYISDGPDETVLQPGETENYKVSDEYVVSHWWTIVASYNFQEGGTNGPLQWKLQARSATTGEPQNYFLIVNPAPSNWFWKPEFQIGQVIEGKLVIGLHIKR